MSDKVKLDSPEYDPSKQSKGKIPFPQRDIVTSNQIANLIQIGSFALHSLHTRYDEASANKIELDGGCKMAAEALFIKTTDKLDSLLNDTDRWTFALQDSLESKLEKMYEQNTAFLTEQTKAAAQISLPHFIYRPTLVKLPISGEWIAHLGPLEDIERSVVGIGATPKQACAAFDAIFTGEPLPDHLVAWLAARESNENESKQKKPNTKKKI